MIVCLRSSRLQSLVLQHWLSVVDSRAAEDPPIVTGSTLWGGTADSAAVEIRWRWAGMREALFVLQPERIETNLVLLSSAGCPEPQQRALVQIFDFVETLPWRAAIHELLQARQ
jgi:hypothetical protein